MSASKWHKYENVGLLTYTWSLNIFALQYMIHEEIGKQNHLAGQISIPCSPNSKNTKGHHHNWNFLLMMMVFWSAIIKTIMCFITIKIARASKIFSLWLSMMLDQSKIVENLKQRTKKIYVLYSRKEEFFIQWTWDFYSSFLQDYDYFFPKNTPKMTWIEMKYILYWFSKINTYLIDWMFIKQIR